MTSKELIYSVRNETENSIAIDFDSVLNSYTTPFDGTDILPDPPVEGSLSGIKSLHRQGYKIIVLSARAKDIDSINSIWNWLEKHGFKEYISEVTNIKPSVKLIVDDRCITFKGDWGQTLYDIDTFEPWHENPALK